MDSTASKAGKGSTMNTAALSKTVDCLFRPFSTNSACRASTLFAGQKCHYGSIRNRKNAIVSDVKDHFSNRIITNPLQDKNIACFQR